MEQVVSLPNKIIGGGKTMVQALLVIIKAYVLMLLRKYGLGIALGFVGELLEKDVFVFHIKAKTPQGEELFKVIAKVIKDGWIDRAEFIDVLKATKSAIPGWIDDVIAQALEIWLLTGKDFRYGTDDKPELFEAFSIAIADGDFNNKELGAIFKTAI